MGTWGLSNGSRLQNSVIDSRIRKAKEKKRKELDYSRCCEVCDTNQGYIDQSHIISVKECKESGRSELAYTVDNLEQLCRKHHEEVEALSKHDREKRFNEKRNG